MFWRGAKVSEVGEREQRSLRGFLWMYRFERRTDRTRECRRQRDRCSSIRLPHPVDCSSFGPGVCRSTWWPPGSVYHVPCELHGACLGGSHWRECEDDFVLTDVGAFLNRQPLCCGNVGQLLRWVWERNDAVHFGLRPSARTEVWSLDGESFPVLCASISGAVSPDQLGVRTSHRVRCVCNKKTTHVRIYVAAFIGVHMGYDLTCLHALYSPVYGN